MPSGSRPALLQRDHPHLLGLGGTDAERLGELEGADLLVEVLVRGREEQGIDGARAGIAEAPDFARNVDKTGMDPSYQGAAEATKFWLAEVDKWETVIKAAGIAAQ